MNYDEDEDGEAKNYIINDNSKRNEDLDDINVMEISDDGDLYKDFSKFNASRKNNTRYKILFFNLYLHTSNKKYSFTLSVRVIRVRLNQNYLAKAIQNLKS